MNNWEKFWRPSGLGWWVFFVKFIFFSILAFFLWGFILEPYNAFLRKSTLYLVGRNLEVMDSRYTEDRGSFSVLFEPYVGGPAPIKNPKPVSIDIFLNTVHFNIIPFLAFLFASPFISWKRLVVFFFAGSVFLCISHLIHIQLGLQSYYFANQTFIINPTIPNVQVWYYKIKLLRFMHGFMEQAGSMIVPAFIWMLYASKWIFSAILSATPKTKKN